MIGNTGWRPNPSPIPPPLYLLPYSLLIFPILTHHIYRLRFLPSGATLVWLLLSTQQSPEALWFLDVKRREY